MGVKLTTEIVNQRIHHRGISMIGEYVNDGLKTLFRCPHNHEWLATPNNVMKGKGCPHCYGTARLTKEVVNERISYKGFVMVGEYVSAHTKSLFKCRNNHEWNASVNSVMRSDAGCPHCAKHGFNISRPGFTYILDFGFCMKYGITNNLDQRLQILTRTKKEFKVVATKYYTIGKDALEWERSIKQRFGGNYVTNDVLKDGWTETLSPEMITEVLDTMIKEK